MGERPGQPHCLSARDDATDGELFMLCSVRSGPGGGPALMFSVMSTMRVLLIWMLSARSSYSACSCSSMLAMASFFSFCAAMSSSSVWLVMYTLASLILRPWRRAASRWPLIFPTASRFSDSSASRSASVALRPALSFSMNCSFSRTCVRICTVVVVFLRSFSSSSLRSSIFSFRLWFSILSCSKSIKCRPSASSSFWRSVCSIRFSWLLKWMFFRRTR
mmetsp:Transcript_49452/g.100431  ORF Transcript_49452/g.100431 Transcript_49452/m.100431 type:complete len:219 (-) Transcript_49452:118-774(-)